MSDQTDKTALGDRMKGYERIQTDLRFSCTKPVYARIDGRSFSKFTKGMNRPFDEGMSRAMIETTKYLVKETHASIGYTQSDEISLVWFADEKTSKIFFNGRIQKMVSNLSSLATAFFMTEAMKKWPAKCSSRLPSFDCRVFELPSLQEAANEFLWRELDATKNSISMAAHHFFGDKATWGKTGEQKIQMMKDMGVDWNDYPAFFKRGTFVRNEQFEIELDAEELAKIPEKHRDVNKKAIRRRMVEMDVPSFRTVTNRVDVVFREAAPVVGVDVIEP